jgi:SSS family solute:Na+ symporter
MNLHWIDWAIIIGVFVVLTGVATYTQRYVRGVADFLSANRCAGRYLLTVSESMSCLGAISLVAWYESGLQSGFTGIWWTMFQSPIGILIAVSGWVIYRYRQTRCLTLAEFLERRYNRKFRIFSGFIIFFSGVLNFGIFPAVGTHFFMTFCGFPPCPVDMLGLFTVDVTYAGVMAVLLIISVYFTLSGGQIAVTITDYIQGIFASVLLAVVALILLTYVGWGPFEDVLLQDAHVHLIHPFRGQNIPDFDVWYYLMYAILAIYATRAWQGSQAYNSSPLSPHEAKMGSIVGTFRSQTILMVSFLLPVAVYVILQHPNFSELAGSINTILNPIENDKVRDQMTVPVAMSLILKTGMVGCFAAVFLAAFVSTHDTYLHSWGSIFVQDIVMPFRKKPFTEKQHMLLLRLAIVGVALFIFIFSLVWKQTEAILLWFQLTAAIWLGGAGAIIIGGLYWRRGTTTAAFVAVLVGTVLSLSGITIQQAYEHGWWGLEGEFFLNGMEITFVTTCICCLLYVMISLLGRQSPYNLDKLLHRGRHAVTDDVVEGQRQGTGIFFRIFAKLGLTSEFNRRDRFLFFLSLFYYLGWFLAFAVVTLYNIIHEKTTGEYVPAESWLTYWRCYIWFMFVFVTVYLIWMTIGGTLDIRMMFQKLRTLKHDERDDGWVDEDRQ